MNNWQKRRNFRKRENADGSYVYTITVDRVALEVSEAVYTAYAQDGYKMEHMEYGLKVSRTLVDTNKKVIRDEHGQTIPLPEREVSLDKLIDENWDFTSAEPSPEQAFLLAEFDEGVELARCLTLLSEEEHKLIIALFFEGLTEKAYAESLGIKQQNVNKRKQRVLKKIKSLWVQGC